MANTGRIDAALIALGCNPLNAEQIECINDPDCADDALGMLDDLVGSVVSSPQYIAREWACHAATSVGYEVAGRFVQVAECSGFGHPPDEDLASAAQIVAALNGFPELRAVNAQVVTALRSVTEMLNAARLIMTDDEARRMAGEAVNTAREIIRVAS